MIFHHATKFFPVSFIIHFQEPGIPFQTINIKFRCKLNPLSHMHTSIFTKRMHKCFGKYS